MSKSTFEILENQAEVARQEGRRKDFLALKKGIEELKEKEVKDRHNTHLEMVKKEFGVGTYIPEIGASVKKIEDGCGTQRGWVHIYISEEKYLEYGELKRKIRKAIESKAASDFFNKLKFSNKSQRIFIGAPYCDILDIIVKNMGLDLPTSEESDEYSMDWLWEVKNNAEKQAKEDGYSDEESEKIGEQAENEEGNSLFEKYRSAVENTINYLLDFHDLELIRNKKGYYIETTSTWEKSCGKIAVTISGVGMFEYNSAKELKEVGPYKSYAEACISHIHWVKDYPRVYGVSSYKNKYEYWIN